MFTIIICSNDETVADGYLTPDMPDDAADRICAAYAEAARKTIEASPHWTPARSVDWDTDQNFSHWHGGKYDQFGKRDGHLACIAGAYPKWLLDLMDKAERAASAAAQAEADVIDKEEAEFAANDS